MKTRKEYEKLLKDLIKLMNSEEDENAKSKLEERYEQLIEEYAALEEVDG